MTSISRIRAVVATRMSALTERQVSFLLAAFYVVLSMVKMRKYLGSGRFWAEEGKIFYSDIVNLRWDESLGYLFHGHIELATNALVLFSTFVKFELAPLVTTFGSFIVQSIPVFLVIAYRDYFVKHWFGIVVFLLALLGLRQSAEVWANSINLHFHFALLAGFLLCKPIVNDKPDWFSRALLLLSGMSGIPANFLTPLYFVAAYHERSRERTVQAMILSVTTVIQFLLIMLHQSSLEGRFIDFDPLTFWIGLLSQQVISPFLWAKAGTSVINIMKDLPGSGAGGWLVMLAFSIIYVLLGVFLAQSRNRISKLLAASAFLLAMASVYASLGDKSVFLSLDGAGRYFFAPNCLLLLAWLGTIDNYRKMGIRIALFIMVLIFAGRVDAYIHGKPWNTALMESIVQNKDLVEIWPTGWEMKRPR